MSTEAPADDGPVRIVVVDDNPIIREAVSVAVQRLNDKCDHRIQLFEAEDGATAWSRIINNEIDLVIVDLYIPVLSGLDLIERIRESPDIATTKILAISASITDARIRSLSAGADQFLQKPVRLVDLIDAICALLHLDPP